MHYQQIYSSYHIRWRWCVCTEWWLNLLTSVTLHGTMAKLKWKFLTFLYSTMKLNALQRGIGKLKLVKCKEFVSNLVNEKTPLWCLFVEVYATRVSVYVVYLKLSLWVGQLKYLEPINWSLTYPNTNQGIISSVLFIVRKFFFRMFRVNGSYHKCEAKLCNSVIVNFLYSTSHIHTYR